MAQTIVFFTIAAFIGILLSSKGKKKLRTASNKNDYKNSFQPKKKSEVYTSRSHGNHTEIYTEENPRPYKNMYETVPKTDNKKEKKTEYLTINEIAKYFEASKNQIEKVLLTLEWIEKRDQWTIATEKGKANGAKEVYIEKSKTKYVNWNKRILENQEIAQIIKSIKNHKEYQKLSNKEKGDQYEIYIANYYRKQGYKISEHGQDNGKKDKGIDVIAKKDKEVILIQCKNWISKNSILKQKDIESIETKFNNYIKNNKDTKHIFNMYEKIKKEVIVSKDCRDYGAKKYMEEYAEDIDFKIIAINEDINSEKFESV